MPGLSRRRHLGVTAAVVCGLASIAAVPTPAAAHPLGNFSVNQYRGLIFQPDRVRVVAVVNTAEIPTVQDKSLVDSDHDGTVTGAERAAYAARTCSDVAGSLSVSVGGDALRWSVTATGYTYEAGTAATAWLTCDLTAPARISERVTVTVANTYRSDRIGWQEMTATGEGVTVESGLPAESTSDRLVTYPEAGNLSAIPNVRTAEVVVRPGGSDGPAPVATAAPQAASGPWLERRFHELAGGDLDPLLIGLAVLLALLLGAGHAALPGHGKTVMAAYLAGRDGRPRDALIVGAAVTVTHTGGVLVVGLLLAGSAALAGDRILSHLGVASGTLIVAVGVLMLIGGLRARGERRAHSHGPVLVAVGAGHHEHPHGHHHHHDHDHDHGHTHEAGRTRWWGSAGIGLAGGLVPSPSALIVLLTAIGQGRAVLGVVLVVAYGVGMAATLTAAGLTLLTVKRYLSVRLAGRIGGRWARFAAVAHRVGPPAIAVLVIAVGLGVAIRAAGNL